METHKYPRTYHFDFSAGAINDDKISASIDGVIGVPIVLTEKVDGSNTSLEADGCFARTHSGPPSHASFDGLKALHGAVKWKIPQGIQLFGEWVFARHSIEYSALPGYFLLFNVRDLRNNLWLSWEDVKTWAKEIEVPTVPVLFQGTMGSEAELKELVLSFMKQPSCCGGAREGVVARVATKFDDNDFSRYVAKYVRANHVDPTNDHWLHKEIIKNGLCKKLPE